MCHSNAKINTGIDDLFSRMSNYDNRHKWDANFESGRMVRDIGPNVQLHYIKTRKVAMVSSRDQYLVIYRKEIPANVNPSGKRALIIAAKSIDHDEYPPVQGAVRAQTKISGYFIEELEPNLCDVHFAVEADFKISLFISKQVAPKSSNYANALREYVDLCIKNGE